MQMQVALAAVLVGGLGAFLYFQGQVRDIRKALGPEVRS